MGSIMLLSPALISGLGVIRLLKVDRLMASRTTGKRRIITAEVVEAQTAESEKPDGKLAKLRY